MTHSIEVGIGENIHNVARRAVDMANDTDSAVTFVFNDTTVTAQPGADPASLVLNYHLERGATRDEMGGTLVVDL